MAPRMHTFLFADLAGFTALTEHQGDDAAADLAVRFCQAASRLAREHGAQVVKRLGDAVLLRGDDAAETVRLGLRLSRELTPADAFLPVHAGAHTGPATERDGDWFGAAVNLAARVADSARGGQLLVTGATVAAAGDLPHVDLESLGPQLFKNVAGATPVYSARSSSSTSCVTRRAMSSRMARTSSTGSPLGSRRSQST